MPRGKIRRRTPSCKKAGKKVFMAWEGFYRAHKHNDRRYYWCRACKGYHATTRPPGIAKVKTREGV